MDCERVESILGEDFFQGLKDFYKNVNESAFDYKVCLVRRSYVLSEIFCNIVEKQSIGSNPCNTDSALLSFCPEIADCFLEKGHFPSILIIDDILIHGRSINAFLVRFEDELIRILREKGCKLEDIAIRTKLTFAVNVKVFVKNVQPSLLLVRYQTKIKCERIEKEVVWRDLSNRISILVSESALANANYVLSTLLKKTERVDSVDTFQRVDTFYRGMLQTAYIRALDFGQGIKAVLTIRVYDSQNDDRTRLIPFVFLPEFTAEARNLVMDVIDNRLSNDGFSIQKWKRLYRLSNEFVSMILSQNLFFVFKQKNGVEEKNILIEEEEISKIARNYGNTNEIMELIELIKNKQLFSENELIELIAIATAESKPLCRSTLKDISDIQQKKLRDAMEQIIFNEGMYAERQAYYMNAGMYMPDELRHHDSRLAISDFLQRISQIASDDFSVYYAIAYALQFMDAGMMVLCVYKSCEVDQKIYCQYCKAGEQSLMIESLNLYKYIPLLSAMSMKCSVAGLEFENELKTYCQEFCISNEEYEKMIHYMSNLSSMGQSIKNWNFNMRIRVYTDYDEKAYKNPYQSILRDFELADEQKKYVSNYYKHKNSKF